MHSFFFPVTLSLVFYQCKAKWLVLFLFLKTRRRSSKIQRRLTRRRFTMKRLTRRRLTRNKEEINKEKVDKDQVVREEVDNWQ